MLVSVLMVGFVAAIIADQRASGLDRDQTQAYAAAHAGLEQLTSDLSALFTHDFSPSCDADRGADGDAAVADGLRRSWIPERLAGTGTGSRSTPDAQRQPDAGGPGQRQHDYGGPVPGLPRHHHAVRHHGDRPVARRRRSPDAPHAADRRDSRLPVRHVLGDRPGVPRRRRLQFGGRVHTNGNLYLAEGDGSTLTIADRVTAVGEIIRTHLPNGVATSGSYTGTVRIPTTIASNPASNVYRNLAANEGSLTNIPARRRTSRSGRSSRSARMSATSATAAPARARLDLPLVADLDGDGVPDAQPIDLIRRPATHSNENTAQPQVFTAAVLLAGERFASCCRTSRRTSPAADRLERRPPMLSADLAPAMARLVAATKAPAGRGPSTRPEQPTGTLPANVTRSARTPPLIGGVIKIEMQRHERNVGRRDQPRFSTWGSRAKASRPRASARRPRTAGPASWHGTSDSCPEPHPNAVIRSAAGA